MEHGDAAGAGACGCVLEWEHGLPTAEELTPLSHPLIPPALAAAFRIGVRGTTAFDCPVVLAHDSPTSHLSLSLRCQDEYECEDGDDAEWEGEGEGEGEGETSGSGSCRGGSGRAAGKKARMVWTPELHHRFVEAVAHLGDKGAVPKSIVRLMNVDGLTRENVASHLQKYRIYLKRTRTTPGNGKPQPPPAFSSRGCDKLERDEALQAVGWKRAKQA